MDGAPGLRVFILIDDDRAVMDENQGREMKIQGPMKRAIFIGLHEFFDRVSFQW